MKSLKKEKLIKKSMKMVGSLSLFLSKIPLNSTCILACYQPKCPDELLK